MLTYKNTGIKKFILDRICQIDDEVVNEDPEYKQLEERPDEILKLVAAKLLPEDNKQENLHWGRAREVCARVTG